MCAGKLGDSEKGKGGGIRRYRLSNSNAEVIFLCIDNGQVTGSS